MLTNVSKRLSLPEDSRLWGDEFLFGVATAAFQIEGDADHRQRTIWDTFCDEPGRIADGSNGLVACDHVARVADDLELLDDLDVDVYRFSLSWARLLKEDGTLNPDGLDFYQRLIEGLRQRDIQPWVTLYHWDLPQHLEDRGGWVNRDTAYRFQDYADRATRALDQGVAAWMTLNEPMCSAYLGYVNGIHAPGRSEPGHYATVAHHLLLAHGLGMDVLRQNQPGIPLGVALNVSCVHPASDDEADVAAAQQADLTFYRRFLDPLLTGRYDDERLERLPNEHRPAIGSSDMALIAQPLDFLGINYYTRACYVSDAERGFAEVPPEGELTDMGWEVYPEGLTQLLVRLNEDYRLPPVYITENGAAFPDRKEDGAVLDLARFEYIQSHLLAIDTAIRHGVDVRGLFYWSFMDNFEWAEGYAKRFGIVHVDYATQERQLKMSGKAWRALMHEKHRRNAPPSASAVGGTAVAGD